MSEDLDVTEDADLEVPARVIAVEAHGLVGRAKPVTLQLADDHPVLLTGSSGSGKSTVLRGIHAVATGNFPLLLTLPVAALRLIRDGGPDIETSREGDAVKLSIGQKSWTYNLGDAPIRDPDEERFGYRRLPRLLRMEGAVTTRAEYVGLRDYFAHRVQPEAPWLIEALADLSIPYVSDDRLFALADQDVSSPIRAEPERRPYRSQPPLGTFRAIDLVDAELRTLCRDNELRAGRRISAIDRELPERVIEAVRGKDATVEEVTGRIEAIEALQERLDQFGLNTARGFRTTRPNADTDSRERAVLLAVLDSYHEKLLASTPLLEDLERFVSAVNRRFRRKALSFHVRRGLRVTPDEPEMLLPSPAVDESPSVPLSLLSSGEQHLVVLLYRLIFGSPKGSLFLVDEPELSLHVAWQRELASDLAEIASHKQSRYLIATHSPSVIAGHLDWEVNFDDLGADE